MMHSFVKKTISLMCAFAVAGGICRLHAAAAEPIVGSKVILSETFDNGSSLVDYADGNTMKITQEEDGNKAMLIEKADGKAVSGNFHLNAQSIISDSDYVIYEFKIKNLNESSFFRSYLGYKENNLDVVALNSGVLFFDSGSKVLLPLNEWHTVSFAVDYYSRKVGYWYDGTKLSGERSIGDFADKSLIETFRFHMTTFSSAVFDSSIYRPTGTVPIKFMLDDVRVYEGKGPRDNIDAVDKTIELSDQSVFESDAEYKNMLSGYWGVHLGSGVVFNNGKKTILQNVPYEKDGVWMVPLSELSLALGVDSGDDVSGAEVKDGVTYIPFDAFAQFTGKKVYSYDAQYNKGMRIMGDSLFAPPSGTNMEKLNSYLLFVRPDAQRIHDEYSKSSLKGVHPRVQATAADFARLRTECAVNSYKSTWKSWIIRRANEYVADPTPVEYTVKDGRLLEVSREVDRRMYTLGMAYQLTGEQKYADRAWIDLKAVSEFSSWHPGHALDVGEMASGVAIGYDWMYDAFTPEQRTVIEKGVYNNCFYDYNILYTSGNGSMSQLAIGDSNWNNICSGGVSLASVAMLDVYPEIAESILSRAVRCIEPAIVRFAPDGAWYEGPDYWELTWQYTAKILSSLQTVFGTSYGLDRLQGLDTSARWAIAMQSPYGIYPYGDSKDYGKSSISLNTPEMLYMSAHYDDPFVTKYVLDKMNPYWATGEQLAMDLLWYDVTTPTTSETMPLDSYYESDGVITMRDCWDKSQQNFVGIHAGKTNADHGHLDGASFVFDSMGIRWAKDTGMGDYNQTGYWDEKDGGDRWKIFKLRAEAHNCIVINPDENQDQIWESTAPITKYETDSYGGIALIDTTELYAKNANNSKRGFFFTDNRQSLVVRDEIDLKKESDIYWFMMTYSDTVMTKVDDRTVLLTQGGKQLKVTFVTDADSAEISYAKAEPLAESYHNPDDKAVDANRLAVKLHDSGSDTVSLTVKLTPVGIVGTEVSAYDFSMDDWRLPGLSVERVNGGCKVSGAVYCPDETPSFLAIAIKKGNVLTDISLKRYYGGYISVDEFTTCNDDETVCAYLMTDNLTPLCKNAETTP